MRTLTSTLLFVAACSFGPVPTATGATEPADIVYLKQEEKLARDVYQAMYVRWGHAIFANIALAEQNHMDAVDSVIRRYRIADITPAAPGVFTFPDLQAAYDESVERGTLSLTEALGVGKVIEEDDIALLGELVQTASEPIVRRVLTHLMAGSTRHLAAFTRVLERVPVCPVLSLPERTGEHDRSGEATGGGTSDCLRIQARDRSRISG